MKSCWNSNPEERPSFGDLEIIFSDFVVKHSVSPPVQFYMQLYRGYKKNGTNLKLLLTLHSGYRNKLFDQYRLFGYL